MSLREAVRTALRGLRANRLRSALTMLGIVIGVAAVILLVAIGNGVQSAVNEYVEPLANLITIVPTVGNVPGGTAPKDLIDADVSALQNPDRAPDVASVTPASTGQALIETDTTESRTSVVGSTDRWLEVNNRDLQTGSFFDETQVRSSAKVVVLGPTAVDSLFGGPAAALGQTVRINRQDFRGIGVMDSVGEPGDNVAVMPLDTSRRYVFGGGDEVNQIIVQATQAAAVPAAEEQVIRILSDRHRIKDTAKRDFEVQSLRSQLTTFNQSSTSSPCSPQPSPRSRWSSAATRPAEPPGYDPPRPSDTSKRPAQCMSVRNIGIRQAPAELLGASHLARRREVAMFTSRFWQLASERALKTFAQSLVAILSATGVGLLTAPWTTALSTAVMAALLSALTSMASAPVGEPDTPNLLSPITMSPPPALKASVTAP